MSKDLKDINLASVQAFFGRAVATAARYKILLFVLLVAGVYGFVTYKIYSLSSHEPNSDSVSAQVTILSPHVDQSVVDQLQSLQDNSVNVNALFRDSRQNPFAE